LAVAGDVLSAVSQMTVDDDKIRRGLLKRMRKENENLPRDGISQHFG
jgi:hypothetical protein